MRLAYLAPLNSEQIVTAQRLGYDGLAVDVGWFDRPRMDELEETAPALADELAKAGLCVTAVSVYGNAVGAPAAEAIRYYERAIQLALRLGSRVVSGVTGRDNALSLEENLLLFAERFGPIAEMAAANGIVIALEPWPGRINGYGQYRWTNLAVSPVMYDRLFALVPQTALGIEYDPSHLAWQGMDYITVAREYAGRIWHVHAKDVLLDEGLLKRGGVHAAGWWRNCLPGLGQIDWPALFAALAAGGYTGDIAVEHEDANYRGERREEGLMLALKTMRPLVEAYRMGEKG